MNERQKKIYEFIKDYTEEYKYPPTIREIALGVGLKSSSTVHGHLDRMRRGGHINFVDLAVRTLSIVEGR